MAIPGMFDAPGIPGMNDLPPMLPPQSDDGTGPGPVLRDPSGITPAQQNAPPTPPPQHPGLFHRLMAGFGAPKMDPMASEWMTPEQQQYLRSQGQAGLASSLMQAGGPRPQGTSNFMSRVGEGMGAGMANWKEIQQNATQRAMQSLQFGWQVQARDMLTKALQENPETGPEASPAEKAARLSKIASRLAMAGPMGAEYAKQYGELSKMVLEGSALSAEQQNKIWTDAIAPSQRAASAADRYQAVKGQTDRIGIATRAQLADQIFNPEKPSQSTAAYQNPDVLEKIPGIGPMLAAAFKLGKITPEDAQYIDKYVAAEVQRGRNYAAHILEHQRLIGEHGALGANASIYYNPFDDVGRATHPNTITPKIPRPPRLPPLKP